MTRWPPTTSTAPTPHMPVHRRRRKLGRSPPPLIAHFSAAVPSTSRRSSANTSQPGRRSAVAGDVQEELDHVVAEGEADDQKERGSQRGQVGRHLAGVRGYGVTTNSSRRRTRDRGFRFG